MVIILLTLDKYLLRSNFDHPSPLLLTDGSFLCVFANTVIVTGKSKCIIGLCFYLSDTDSYSYTSSSFASSEDYINSQRRRNSGFLIRSLLFVVTVLVTSAGELACWHILRCSYSGQPALSCHKRGRQKHCLCQIGCLSMEG